LSGIFLVERIEFQTADGLTLRMRRKVRRDAANPIPVLMVHGAGVRSRIFNPPREGTLNLDDTLADEGFDVFNLDWRASIDQPPNQWTLDRAAVLDYPAAVAKVLEITGKDEVRTMIHCQGSTSFMLSLVAGLLPQVSMVVSNAVSLHPVVPTLARLKALYAVPSLGRFFPYLNPQWGISAPPGLPRVFDAYVRSIHHECNNPVCKWASFTFGSGFPTLWPHENLDEATHNWLAGEFAHVPMTFFRQIGKSIRAGHLVTTGEFPDLPATVVDAAPKTDARVVFLAGGINACFLPESQARYGHLDVFIGKDAPRDTYPLIVDELKKG
jgi:hypothetical protein